MYYNVIYYLSFSLVLGMCRSYRMVVFSPDLLLFVLRNVGLHSILSLNYLKVK